MCKSLQIGDICVFGCAEDPSKWMIGKVMQFAYFSEKKHNKKARNYKSVIVNLDDKFRSPLGVLCTWFNELSHHITY